MKRIALAVVFALLAAVTAGLAQEVVTLTSPIALGTRTTYDPVLLHIEKVGATWIVVAEVKGNDGVFVRDVHDSTTATTGAALVNTLNAPGTYANSLFKRVLLHLQSEGKIAAGSVTGTPQ
jgi:hypothetical protein